jgi:hypothetical protein
VSGALPPIGDTGPSSDWTILKSTPNPWGVVPVTAGGQSLTDRAKTYMARIEQVAALRDSVSTRHHYMPQSYLRGWSTEQRKKRIWVLHTSTGEVRRQGVADTCVQEHFYRVQGPEGEHHQQVERIMAVLDDELAGTLALFRRLTSGDDLTFEQFMILGHMIVLSRNRTPQRRRLMGANADFIERHQLPEELRKDPVAIKVTAEAHLDAMFGGMFEAADVMTTRWLEVWDDPRGRFVTCDSPVQTPRGSHVVPDLLSSPRVWWPISPHRALCLVNDSNDEAKVSFKKATAGIVKEVNTAMIRRRESVIIATEDQLSSLPVGKPLPKRTQVYIRCEPWKKPGQCRVEMRECYAAESDIDVCGTYFPLMRPEAHA